MSEVRNIRVLYVFRNGEFHYFGTETEWRDLLRGEPFENEGTAIVIHDQVRYYWRNRIL